MFAEISPKKGGHARSLSLCTVGENEMDVGNRPRMRAGSKEKVEQPRVVELLLGGGEVKWVL